MKKQSSLEAKIAALEKRIKELEDRPQQVLHVYSTPLVLHPVYQPPVQWPPYGTPIITCGSLPNCY